MGKDVAVASADNDLTRKIIGAAIEVHKHLGPGLLESAYHACLAHELRETGFDVHQEVPVPVRYKGVRLECGYRLDLLVHNQVVVEVKSVDRLESIHTAQVISYLKLTGHRIGLLFNFNVPVLKDGLKRIILD